MRELEHLTEYGEHGAEYRGREGAQSLAQPIAANRAKLIEGDASFLRAAGGGWF